MKNFKEILQETVKEKIAQAYQIEQEQLKQAK